MASLILRSLRLTLTEIIPKICITSFSTKINNNESDDLPIYDMENPFEKEQEKCILCKYDINVDYKNVKLLSQFQSPYTGRIYGRHITRLCKQQQEIVEKEITKAQSAALMSTYLKEMCYLEDPRLFDPDQPLRPHRF